MKIVTVSYETYFRPSCQLKKALHEITFIKLLTEQTSKQNNFLFSAILPHKS